jgi:dihydroneopterin aldolase
MRRSTASRLSDGTAVMGRFYDAQRRFPFVMDSIAIRGIRAYGRHGANPGERDQPQPFDIEVELELDLSRARSSDALADTVDYDALHARVVAIVEERSFALLERLGEEILREVKTDGRVCAARVSIAKPGILRGATPVMTVAYGYSERGRPYDEFHAS